MKKKYNFLIVGDVMIDEYVMGDYLRNSPEADCPILNYASKEYRLGGAGNVASNLISLDQNCHIVALVGNDAISNVVHKLCEDIGVSHDLIMDENRPTTLKSRYVDKTYKQYLRVDTESTHDASIQIQEKILQILENVSYANYDMIILQDYNKGTLTEVVINVLLKKSRIHNIKIAADPKYNNFMLLSKCDLFKPNLKELSAFAKMSVEANPISIEKALLSIGINETCCVIITLAEQGVYFRSIDKVGKINGFAVQDPDVSGAGDTVIAVLSLMLIDGYNIEDMAKVANNCGANVCSKQGVSNIESSDYQSFISQTN